MSKQNVLTLRVPHDLKEQIAQLANEQGVSMNQLASYLLAQSVTAAKCNNIIARYKAKRTRAETLQAFDEMWARRKALPPLPESEIPEWDRWPEGMSADDFKDI